MQDEVVAAIDGSPASYRAAELAAHLASARGGALHLVAVAPERKGLLGRLAGSVEGAAGHREADLRSAEALVRPVAPICHTQLLEGPVVDSILDLCAEVDARLLAVGSGRRAVRLGSVSTALLRQANCPVLVVREGASRGPRVQSILLAFDGTEGAWNALRSATRLAVAAEAGLHLVWVLRPGFPLPRRGLPLGTGEIQELAGSPEEEELARAVEAARSEGARVTSALFDLGDAAERLLARAEADDVDLVVIGARGDRPAATRRLLGGISDRVVARTERPVLVVR